MAFKVFKIYLLIASAALLILGGIFFVFITYSGGDDVSGWLHRPYQDKNIITEVSDDQVSPEIVRDDIVLMFGGDIMLSRTVNAKMSAYNDYLWPLKKIASTSAAADISIFNLESPFLKDANYKVLTGSFSFKANPKAVATLALAGADVISLANNHMMNMGKQGIVDTIDILQANNIEVVGAGLNSEEAYQGVVVNRDDWRVGFLAYAYPKDASVARDNRPGIATMDMDQLVEDIARLKLKADIVIVSMHAGIEYKSEPNWEQKAFAHAAIEAGADAVIGHHPHWVQSHELYQGKPIFYSLGNLVFDQMFSEATRHGLLLRLTFKKNSSSEADFLPIRIDDYGQTQLIIDDKEIDNFWRLYDLPRTDHLVWSEPLNN